MESRIFCSHADYLFFRNANISLYSADQIYFNSYNAVFFLLVNVVI